MREKRTHLTIAVLAVFQLVVLAGCFAVWRQYGTASRHRSMQVPVAATVVPPPLPEQVFQPISPDDAVRANEAIKPSTEPVEAALPFNLMLLAATPIDQRSAVDCLTAAVYFEAASETEQGQRGVAQVVLNRVRHPAFPKTVCGVVYQGSTRQTGCQFTFTCDGSLSRQPSMLGWLRARRIAQAALTGAVEPSVGMATHYHTIWVLPYWAGSLAKITTIGAHVFYRWDGYWGRRGAFTGHYAGGEVANVAQAEDLSAPADMPTLIPETDLTGVDLPLVRRTDSPVAEDRRTADSTLPSVPLALPTAPRPLADETTGRLKLDDTPPSPVPVP